MILEQKVIKYKDRIIFEKIVMSSQFKRIPKLFQEEEACFLFLSKGAFHFRTPTNFLTFHEGDAMLSKCGNYFIEQVSLNEKQQEKTISAIGAYFYPSIVKHFFQTDISIDQFQKNFDTIKLDIQPLLKSFLNSIDFIIDHPQIADENLIVNKLKELLLILSKSEQSNTINAFVSSLFVPYEYEFSNIIQHNLYSNLSLNELAHLCNSSLATFKRRFVEFYNLSPAKYITLKKLEKSKQLLHLKSKPIADIAYECGFETVTNFNKVFKSHFKQSPTEYRLS